MTLVMIPSEVCKDAKLVLLMTRKHGVKWPRFHDSLLINVYSIDVCN